MKQTILDILQQTLGLPNSPVAQITVGARVMYADEFSASLAEKLDALGIGDLEKAIDAYSCDCPDPEEPEVYCTHCRCNCESCEDCGSDTPRCAQCGFFSCDGSCDSKPHICACENCGCTDCEKVIKGIT